MASRFPPAASLPKILLVEDYTADSMLMKIGVKRAEAAIELCVETTGEAALAKLATAPAGGYRLAIIDLNLPRLSGLDVLKAIKADPHLSDLPVIMMTSSKSSDDVERAYALGADGYLVKPFEPKDYEALAIALAEACDDLARLETAVGKQHFLPRPQSRRPSDDHGFL